MCFCSQAYLWEPFMSEMSQMQVPGGQIVVG